MNKNLKFLIVGILVLSGSTLLYQHYAYSASTPLQKLQSSYVNLPANLAIGQNVSVLQIPLTRVVLNSEGIGNAPYADHPTIDHDRSLTLTLYNGTTVNGTLIAAVATNVGSNDVTINQMDIIGAIKQGSAYAPIIEKHIVGCTQDEPFKQNITTTFPNGTTISRNVDSMVKCGQTAYHGSIVLKPGQSFTTYIVGDMKKSGTSINKFSAGVDYAIPGINHMYGIVLPFQTIG